MKTHTPYLLLCLLLWACGTDDPQLLTPDLITELKAYDLGSNGNASDIRVDFNVESWQAVAAGGTSIGIKGMMVAAKTIALTAIDIYTDPAIVGKAREELLKRRGEDFEYTALVGDRDPPLDYRK